MGIIQIFERFAADFEIAVQDDNWSRLEKYLAEDATYENIGGPDPKYTGRAAIIAYLQNDVANNDRRFDTRTLVALTSPTSTENHLSRRWRCTYKLAGAPDLVVEGEARYVFEGELIKEIEEELAPASVHIYSEWMRQHGNKLFPAVVRD